MTKIIIIAAIAFNLGIACGRKSPEQGIVQSMVKLKYSGDSALLTTVTSEHKRDYIYAIVSSKMAPGYYPPVAFYVCEITDSVKQAHYKLAERLK